MPIILVIVTRLQVLHAQTTTLEGITVSEQCSTIICSIDTNKVDLLAYAYITESDAVTNSSLTTCGSGYLYYVTVWVNTQANDISRKIVTKWTTSDSTPSNCVYIRIGGSFTPSETGIPTFKSTKSVVVDGVTKTTQANIIVYKEGQKNPLNQYVLWGESSIPDSLQKILLVEDETKFVGYFLGKKTWNIFFIDFNTGNIKQLTKTGNPTNYQISSYFGATSISLYQNQLVIGGAFYKSSDDYPTLLTVTVGETDVQQVSIYSSALTHSTVDHLEPNLDSTRYYLYGVILKRYNGQQQEAYEFYLVKIGCTVPMFIKLTLGIMDYRFPMGLSFSQNTIFFSHLESSYNSATNPKPVMRSVTDDDFCSTVSSKSISSYYKKGSGFGISTISYMKLASATHTGDSFWNIFKKHNTTSNTFSVNIEKVDNYTQTSDTLTYLTKSTDWTLQQGTVYGSLDSICSNINNYDFKSTKSTTAQSSISLQTNSEDKQYTLSTLISWQIDTTPCKYYEGANTIKYRRLGYDSWNDLPTTTSVVTPIALSGTYFKVKTIGVSSAGYTVKISPTINYSTNQDLSHYLYIFISNPSDQETTFLKAKVQQNAIIDSFDIYVERVLQWPYIQISGGGTPADPTQCTVTYRDIAFQKQGTNEQVQSIADGRVKILSFLGDITISLQKGFSVTDYDFVYKCNNVWSTVPFSVKVIDEFVVAGCTDIITPPTDNSISVAYEKGTGTQLIKIEDITAQYEFCNPSVIKGKLKGIFSSETSTSYMTSTNNELSINTQSAKSLKTVYLNTSIQVESAESIKAGYIYEVANKVKFNFMICDKTTVTPTAYQNSSIRYLIDDFSKAASYFPLNFHNSDNLLFKVDIQDSMCVKLELVKDSATQEALGNDILKLRRQSNLYYSYEMGDTLQSAVADLAAKDSETVKSQFEESFKFFIKIVGMSQLETTAIFQQVVFLIPTCSPSVKIDMQLVKNESIVISNSSEEVTIRLYSNQLKTDGFYYIDLYNLLWFNTSEAKCPIKSIDYLQNSNLIPGSKESVTAGQFAMNSLSNPIILLNDQDIRQSIKLKPSTDLTYTLNLVAHLATQIQKSVSMVFKICGSEKIELKNTTLKAITLQPNSSFVYFNSSLIEQEFKYTPANGLTVKDCPIMDLKIYSDANLTQQLGLKAEDTVQVTKTFPNNSSGQFGLYPEQLQLTPLGVNITSVTSPIIDYPIFVKLLTGDGREAVKEFRISLCGTNVPQRLVTSKDITVQALNWLHKNGTLGQYKLPFSQFKLFFSQAPPSCPYKFSVISADKLGYTDYDNAESNPDSKDYGVYLDLSKLELKSPQTTSVLLTAKSSMLDNSPSVTVTLNFNVNSVIQYLISLIPKTNYPPKFNDTVPDFQTTIFEDESKQTNEDLTKKTPVVVDPESDPFTLVLESVDQISKFATLTVENSQSGRFIQMEVNSDSLIPQTAGQYVFQATIKQDGKNDIYTKIKWAIKYQFKNGSECISWKDKQYNHPATANSSNSTNSTNSTKSSNSTKSTKSSSGSQTTQTKVFVPDYSSLSQPNKKEERIVEEVKKVKPVEVKIGKLSREGQLKIEFNQPLVIPPQFKKQQSSKSTDETTSQIEQQRMLQETTESEEQTENIQDVIQIQINSGTSEPIDSTPPYTLVEWTEEFLSIQIDFQKPLSYSNQDKIQIKVLKPELFISKANNSMQLDPVTSTKLSSSMTKQLPKGVSEQAIQKSAETTTNSMNSVLIVQLVFQVFVKGLFDKVLEVIYFLQIVRTLSIYKVNLPANLEMFLTQLKIMINFESLSADNLIGLVFPGVTIKQLLFGEKDSAQDSNVLTNFLRQYGVFIAGGLIGFLGLIALIVVKKLRKMVIKKIRGVIKTMLWSGLMRSIAFGYINQCISILVFVQAKDFNWSLNNIAFVGAYSYALLLYPAILAYISSKSSDSLDSPYVEERMKMLEVRTSQKNNTFSKYQHSFFFIRRFLFVYTVMFLNQYPGIQVQVLLLVQTLYLVVLDFPRALIGGRRVQMMNEFILMILFYHMACFTQYIGDLELQYNLSTPFLAVLGFAVVVNFILLLQPSIRLTLLKIIRFKLLMDYKRKIKKQQARFGEEEQDLQEGDVVVKIQKEGKVVRMANVKSKSFVVKSRNIIGSQLNLESNPLSKSKTGKKTRKSQLTPQPITNWTIQLEEEKDPEELFNKSWNSELFSEPNQQSKPKKGKKKRARKSKVELSKIEEQAEDSQ